VDERAFGWAAVADWRGIWVRVCVCGVLTSGRCWLAFSPATSTNGGTIHDDTLKQEIIQFLL